MSAADLDRVLQGSGPILLDSSVILAYVNANEAVHHLALHLFRRIADAADSLSGCFSAVSVAECLVRPIQLGPHAVAIMATLLQGYPNLELIPVDYAIGARAAHLRARFNLRTPDALIAATAVVHGCSATISNDDKWGRLASTYTSVQWLYLDAFR